MEIQHFCGQNNRLALEKVRASMGPDALIISNKKTKDGIRISATLDVGRSLDKPVVESPTNEIVLGYLNKELKGLRSMLQEALGERSWQDAAGKDAVIATLEQRLSTLGLNCKSIEMLTKDTKPGTKLSLAWQDCMQKLGGRITSDFGKERSDFNIRAIIGGTNTCRGLGIRQLVMRLFPSRTSKQILVISVSTEPSQLLAQFCKSKKIKYLQLKDPLSLGNELRKHSKFKDIFIETQDLAPQLGAEDPIVRDLFAQNPTIMGVLMLPAIADSDFLQLIGEHVSSLPLSSALISKTPEAISLGGVLNFLLLHPIPISGLLVETNPLPSALTSDAIINTAKRMAKKNLARVELNGNGLDHWDSSIPANSNRSIHAQGN